MLTTRTTIFAAGVTCLSTALAAAPINFDGTGGAWEVSYVVNQVGQNSVGRFEGLTMGIGILGVVPNAKGEDGGPPGTPRDSDKYPVTVGDGTPTIGSASQDGVVIQITGRGNTLNPNAFGGGVILREDTRHLADAWDVVLSNGEGPSKSTREFKTPSICNTSADIDCAGKLLPDPVSNVKLSFSTGKTTPTFSWELGEPVDKVSVSYYDLNVRDSNDRADRIIAQGLAPDATAFTIPEHWNLKEDGKYAFRIDTRILRRVSNGTATSVEDGGDTPSGYSAEGAALAETITFYDFTPGISELADDVLLPVNTETKPDGNPVFNFDNPVVAAEVQFYDPIVAIGYDYVIGAGDPLFASFILPDIGDGFFDLQLWDGTDYVFDSIVAANDEYFFGGTGVERFRILGIETSAGLDPNDGTAFVTGLSFVSDGRFTGSMTPISLEVPDPAPIPLPASGLILASGFGLLAYSRKRRNHC